MRTMRMARRPAPPTAAPTMTPIWDEDLELDDVDDPFGELSEPLDLLEFPDELEVLSPVHVSLVTMSWSVQICEILTNK